MCVYTHTHTHTHTHTFGLALLDEGREFSGVRAGDVIRRGARALLLGRLGDEVLDRVVVTYIGVCVCVCVCVVSV